MLVSTLLADKSREIITVKPSASIGRAMDLLISHGIGCLPVLDDGGKLIGIVSDKDIFRKIHETHGNYQSLNVGDIMTTDLIVGLPSDEVTYIAGLMKVNWIRHIPIVDGDKIVGLVSLRDIIKTIAQTTDVENRYLRMYMDGLHTRDRSADE